MTWGAWAARGQGSVPRGRTKNRAGNGRRHKDCVGTARRKVGGTRSRGRRQARSGWRRSGAGGPAARPGRGNGGAGREPATTGSRPGRGGILLQAGSQRQLAARPGRGGTFDASREERHGTALLPARHPHTPGWGWGLSALICRCAPAAGLQATKSSVARSTSRRSGSPVVSDSSLTGAGSRRRSRRRGRRSCRASASFTWIMPDSMRLIIPDLLGSAAILGLHPARPGTDRCRDPGGQLPGWHSPGADTVRRRRPGQRGPRAALPLLYLIGTVREPFTIAADHGPLTSTTPIGFVCCCCPGA